LHRPGGRIWPRPCEDPQCRTCRVYLLADYLDQQGRATRGTQIPPAAFWAAAASYADPGDLGALGHAAYDCGLYRDAAQLDKKATAHGDTFAASRLVDNLHCLHPTDQRPARWSAAHASLNNPDDVARLLRALRAAGAGDQVTALAGRIAARIALDDPYPVAHLLGALREVGAGEQVAALLARDPAGHAALDDLYGVAFLLGELREVGAGEQADVLTARLPGAGMFEFFYRQEGHQERFRFGREADGSPAGQWGWEDLD
jgi:hypothetical protein